MKLENGNKEMGLDVLEKAIQRLHTSQGHIKGYDLINIVLTEKLENRNPLDSNKNVAEHLSDCNHCKTAYLLVQKQPYETLLKMSKNYQSNE